MIFGQQQLGPVAIKGVRYPAEHGVGDGPTATFIVVVPGHAKAEVFGKLGLRRPFRAPKGSELGVVNEIIPDGL